MQVWVILFTTVITSTVEALWIKLIWFYCIADRIQKCPLHFWGSLSHHQTHCLHSNVVYCYVSAFDSMTLAKNGELYIVIACLLHSTARGGRFKPNTWGTLHHFPGTQTCTDPILVSDIGADPEKNTGLCQFQIFKTTNIFWLSF